MSVAYRSSATANSGASTASSIVVNSPAGVQADDYLFVAVAYTGGTGVTITQPTGWQLVSTSNTSTTYGVQIFRRHAIASEPVSYTFSLSSAQYVSAISVAYSGLRVFAAGGSFYPQGAITPVDNTGSSTGTHSLISSCFPLFASRFVVSYNTTAVLTVTGAGTGFTTRADTSTTATSFIQLALTDGLTSNGTLATTAISAASLSGSATNNKSVVTFLRQDQTQVTSPTIDSAGMSFPNGVGSGSVTFSPSLVGEQAIIAFHIRAAFATVTALTTTDINWQQIAAVQDPGNTTRIEVWTATLGAAGSAPLANYTLSGAATLDISFMSFAAAGLISNFSTANASSGAPSCSLVTTGPNSLVLGFYSGTFSSGVVASGANTLLYNYLYASGVGTGNAFTQVVASSGTTATSSASAPTTDPWALVQVEVAYPKKTGDFLQFMD